MQQARFTDTGTTSGSRPTSPEGRFDGEPHRLGRRLAWALAAVSLAYALYRAYYALGGTIAMIGVPVSEAQFRAINAVGSAVIVLFSAVLPLVVVLVRRFNGAVPVLGWIGAVGCCMHALVDITLRVLSLTGQHPTELPAEAWRSFDRRTADLQDLLFNEPWFLVVGLLWAALGLTFVSRRSRRAWAVSAVLACVALSVVGVLSGVGVIGSARIG